MMRAPLNSLSPVLRDYSRSVVSRPSGDNDLLRACDRVHCAVIRIAAFGTFALIGAGWYLLVALRAGGAA
ncbi:hypothetical protein KDW82_04145 [Burkholderia vietnamiensis]|uniref:hypothetical protein n=1 Tax=Burkholderia vietnamiensis TaxID=60552 RepID=UPI001B9CD91E|nr:hypothetical protein [Burkholderia vietnamiensis]MBR8188252.1 hypothetical protein [Burkholderia vietnamiensis]